MAINAEIKLTKIDNPAKDAPDTIRIKRTKASGQVKGFMNVLKFQDKDTKQFISYCPCFDLSGYGETKEKALEMLEFSVKEFFHYLLSLSPKQMQAELNSLGWKQNKISHKEYSKAFVDVNGNLQNFNAVGDKVERMVLSAA